MKILKAIGLLFVICFMNNIQSMEPMDEYFIERQFLEGNISAHDYLSYIASLSGDYAYKIQDLRNAQAINPNASYEFFLGRLELMPAMAQQVLASGDMQRYEQMVKRMRQYTMNAIDSYYLTLEQGIQMRHGRLT